MKNFKEFLNESVQLSIRLQELIRHAYESKSNLEEQYLEIDQKYLIRYNRAMKSEVIKYINSFENTWIDKLIKLNINFENIPEDDKEFIEYLYHLIMRMYNVITEKVNTINRAELTSDLERDTKDISLILLERLSKEFIMFINAIREVLNEPVVREYIGVFGNDVNRIMTKEFLIPEVVINDLKESGCNYEYHRTI